MSRRMFEIEQDIITCLEQVDSETGEISDDVAERLNALTMERDQKIENVGMYVKELKAEAEAIKAEEIALKRRREIKERRLEGLKGWLSAMLDGQVFERAKVKISFTKSSPLVITDETKIPDGYMRTVKTPNKEEIKAAIKNGESFDWAHIDDRKNIRIQ